MAFSAVIFDLYGTLLTRPRDRTPYAQVFRASSRSPSETHRIAITRHLPTLADFAAAVGCGTSLDIDRLQAMLDADANSIVPFPDAEPTVKQLRATGINTAVVSNLATPYKIALPRHLASLFDATVFSCDVGHAKPDPQIYEYALQQLDVPAVETVMVGDSYQNDVAGPARVGIQGIHLVRNMDRRVDNCISTLLDIVAAT